LVYRPVPPGHRLPPPFSDVRGVLTRDPLQPYFMPLPPMGFCPSECFPFQQLYRVRHTAIPSQRFSPHNPTRLHPSQANLLRALTVCGVCPTGDPPGIPMSVVHRNPTAGPFEPDAAPSGLYVTEKSVSAFGVLQPPTDRDSPELSVHFHDLLTTGLESRPPLRRAALVTHPLMTFTGLAFTISAGLQRLPANGPASPSKLGACRLSVLGPSTTRLHGSEPITSHSEECSVLFSQDAFVCAPARGQLPSTQHHPMVMVIQR